MVNIRTRLTSLRRSWILWTILVCIALLLLSASPLPLPGLLPSSFHTTPQIAALHTPLYLSTQARGLSQILEEIDQIKPDLIPIFDPLLTIGQENRYWHLGDVEGRFMITTLTRQIAAQLPDLLNTIYILVTFLGPERLSFSFLEGPSDDGTSEILTKVLHPLLIRLGVSEKHIHIRTGEKQIDFSTQNRIEVLARLRNKALSPLWEDPNFRDTAAVVFLNDVWLRAADVLELLHQHMSGNRVGITAAMDWMEKEPEYFYDIWVARTIETGDLFYPIETPWWAPSDNLFSNSPKTHQKWLNLEPFQVYSAWNGMAVLSPVPFLPPHNVRFRFGGKGECPASECQTIATDFWRLGMGRIQVVPSVQLAYTKDVAVLTAGKVHEQKTALGWKDGVPPGRSGKMVRFQSNPPEKIKCHPWPEKNGLDANVWESHTWVDPV